MTLCPNSLLKDPKQARLRCLTFAGTSKRQPHKSRSVFAHGYKSHFKGSPRRSENLRPLAAGLARLRLGYSARQIRCAGQKESEQRSGSGCRSRSSSPTPPSPLPPRHTRWCINARARARGAHSPNKMASDSFRGRVGGRVLSPGIIRAHIIKGVGLGTRGCWPL